ncbi:hypothetical protein VNO80_07944 [Phaseolus coccineus]|uniref:Uncharacterized protein n=1 Tax=Phaseolus coccineus TaxID=3886 RepID=A0AAN9NQ41_PHACN
MQIVNWITNLKFLEEAKLSSEAKDLICRLLCNVEQRLGTKGVDEIKVDKQTVGSSKAGPWRKMLPSKDVNFVGYTYKNFEIVNDHEYHELLLLLFVTICSGLVDIFFNELVLLCDTDDESSVAANQPVRGSFLNLYLLKWKFLKKANHNDLYQYFLVDFLKIMDRQMWMFTDCSFSHILLLVGVDRFGSQQILKSLVLDDWFFG